MTAPTQDQARQRREQAAATAAALYAASRTPIPTAAVALASVRGTAAAVANGSAAASRIIENLWAATNPYDPASVAAFAAQAGQTIIAAQRAVATATTAGQLAMLRAAGVDTSGPVEAAIPDDVRGASVHFGADAASVHAKPNVMLTYQGEDGSPVHARTTAADASPAQIYQRAAAVYRVRVAQGADHETARAAAVQRISDITDGNLMLAQRLAEQQTLRTAQHRDPRIIGYRRVIHPELSKGGVCGMCVAAAQRIYHVAELKEIHDRCKCGVAPVTDLHDPGMQLNRDDLRGLYTDAGTLIGRNYSSFSEDLKRTRYDVVHHAELGPVLTRVKGEKVPYYSTGKPAPAHHGRHTHAAHPGAAAAARPVPPASTHDLAHRHSPVHASV